MIHLGIREQLLISVAGGLALAGMRPVAHTFASFLVERPVRADQAGPEPPGRGRGAGQRGCVLRLRRQRADPPGPGDVALLATLPGWTVHIPGHPDEAERQLRAAAAGDGLVYIRLSTAANAGPLDGRRGSSPCCAPAGAAPCWWPGRWPTR